MIGIAAGNTVTTALPNATVVLENLDSIGALDPLTGNGGTPSSANNGIYTLMGYALIGTYSNVGNVEDTTSIPTTNYYPGGSFGNVDLAFGNTTANTTLLYWGNYWIANIAANNPTQAASSNDAYNAMAEQLLINQNNCVQAGIDIGNVVNDIGNANLVSNSVSTVLGLTSRLHDIGTDITTGGSAQFFQTVANTNVLSGQAVIASMREGRNIAVLNAVGIQELVLTVPNSSIASSFRFLIHPHPHPLLLTRFTCTQLELRSRQCGLTRPMRMWLLE